MLYLRLYEVHFLANVTTNIYEYQICQNHNCMHCKFIVILANLYQDLNQEMNLVCMLQVTFLNYYCHIQFMPHFIPL